MEYFPDLSSSVQSKMQTLFIWEVRFLLDEMISQSHISEIMIKRTFHTIVEFCETCCLRVNSKVFTKSQTAMIQQARWFQRSPVYFSMFS